MEGRSADGRPEREHLDASLIGAGSRWGAWSPTTRVRPDGVSGSLFLLCRTTWGTETNRDAESGDPARVRLRRGDAAGLPLQAQGRLRGPQGRHPPAAEDGQVPLLLALVRDRHGRGARRLAAARGRDGAGAD